MGMKYYEKLVKFQIKKSVKFFYAPKCCLKIIHKLRLYIKTQAKINENSKLVTNVCRYSS